MTLRIVLLVDALILRKNNAHIGVDMIRMDRCVLDPPSFTPDMPTSICPMERDSSLPVATQWTSSCGRGVKILAFIADEQQLA
ncbi:hypothetical protein TNCV_2844071 [Trichonephila clavipes]|nr:hypothetical protein TNCV_2844071 [Trichonephila clavipes]